jgi:hypothetical protein
MRKAESTRAAPGVTAAAVSMSRRYEVAVRAFPDPSPADRLCREAIEGLTQARRWTGLAVAELDSALETAWADVGEIRAAEQDFDQFSASSTSCALENASRFFIRSADKCVDVWIALAQLRGLAEQLKRGGRAGTHG